MLLKFGKFLLFNQKSGEAGSGKTNLAIQIALNVNFFIYKN